MSEIRLSPDGSTITVFLPMAWRRRGGRKVIVAAPGCDDWAPPPKIDGTLLKALARAHRWRRMLESGEYGTLAEMADAERISRSMSAASCGSRSSPPTSSNVSSTVGRPWGSRSSCSRFRSSGSASG